MNTNIKDGFAICEEVIVEGFAQHLYIKDFSDEKFICQDIDGNEFKVDINKCKPVVSPENSGKTTFLRAAIDTIINPPVIITFTPEA